MSSSSVPWLALVPLHISAGPHMWEDVATPAHIPSQMRPWLQDLLSAQGLHCSNHLPCLSSACAQGTPGGSCAEETCNQVLRLVGILFAVSSGHQKTSFLTGYIACGCWYMLTLFSAATLSPADIQALASLMRLGLPFLSLPPLPPSALSHKPIIIAWEIICFSEKSILLSLSLLVG